MSGRGAERRPKLKYREARGRRPRRLLSDPRKPGRDIRMARRKEVRSHRDGQMIYINDGESGSVYVRVTNLKTGRRKGINHSDPLQAASRLANKLRFDPDDIDEGEAEGNG
jgi:hypothetical protein